MYEMVNCEAHGLFWFFCFANWPPLPQAFARWQPSTWSKPPNLTKSRTICSSNSQTGSKYCTQSVKSITEIKIFSNNNDINRFGFVYVCEKSKRGNSPNLRFIRKTCYDIIFIQNHFPPEKILIFSSSYHGFMIFISVLNVRSVDYNMMTMATVFAHIFWKMKCLGRTLALCFKLWKSSYVLFNFS